MLIRLAQKSDIPQIAVLYTEFFSYNAGQQPKYYKPATEPGSYPESVVENETEDLFVAEAEGNLVGLLHILEEKTPPYDCFVEHRYATIMDLYIKENFRKQGVGRCLLQSAKEWAKSRSLDYIELNVLAENLNGIGFYEHEGFGEISHIMRLGL